MGKPNMLYGTQISTNETNINQHTQNINGLTTDVNGLKTSKQDKLIAGTGIEIASDGKTISVGVTPTKISINNFNQLKTAISNMRAGDRLVGDFIYYNPTSASTIAGIAMFDIEKLDYNVTTSSIVTDGFIGRVHSGSRVKYNGTVLTLQSEAFSSTINVSVDTKNNWIVFNGGCKMVVNSDNTFYFDLGEQLSPHVYVKSESIFKNVYLLQY